MDQEPGENRETEPQQTSDVPKPKNPGEHSTADYDNYPEPEKPIRNWTKILTIFIIVLILAGGGAGAYLYLKNHKSKPVKTVHTTQTVAQAPAAVTLKTYTSPNFYLTFSYPANWTIVDTGGGSMTATSPLMKLKDATGQEADGKIVMTILNGSAKLPGFTTGANASAVLASKKITYAKPTQTQRADTYLTFITYSSTTASNGLDAVYISGNNGYTLGQSVPQADLLQVSPVINLTFVNSTGKPLTLSAGDWADGTFSTPLLNMLESLAIT
jgi:hypothetical protein